MFKLIMTNKGFADNQLSIETPSDVSVAEKPLKSRRIKSQRVDINVLKSKLQETESKELKKNVLILSSLILTLGVLGIYFSLWVKFANYCIKWLNMSVKNIVLNVKKQLVSKYLVEYLDLKDLGSLKKKISDHKNQVHGYLQEILNN